MKIKEEEILIFVLIATTVFGIPAAVIASAYNAYKKHERFCTDGGYEYNFELFGDSICEADDSGKEEIFESDLAKYLPVKDYKIVKRIKNPDGNYTMEVVGKYKDTDMEYHGVFRNVISLEQEKQLNARRKKEIQEVQKEVEKQREILCTELPRKAKNVKSVRYDKKTNTCFVVNTNPIINPESECENWYANFGDFEDKDMRYSALVFTSKTSNRATGDLYRPYGFDLKNVNASFKNFIVSTEGSDIEVRLDVTFPNAKTISEDFAEKCATDKNCTCTETANGNKICEKHVTYPIFIHQNWEPLILDEIANLDPSCKLWTDNCQTWLGGAGDAGGYDPKTCAKFDKKTGTFSITHSGAKVVFDNVKKVSDKIFHKYNDCRYKCSAMNEECFTKCAESVTNGNPQSLCLDTYLGAKYKNGICEIPFSGKVSKPEDLKNKKAFESCQINKIIAGKGNTATANAVCNGMKAKINLKNYQVQKRNGKNR